MTQTHCRHHSGLPLPYGKMDQSGDLSRLSADIPAKDKDLIKSICPKKGILNQLTQNIFFSIVNNLRSNGITYYSPEHESYLCALVLRGCASIELAVPITVGDVNGRVTLSCTGAEGSIQQFGYPPQEDQHGQSGSEADPES